MPGLPMENLLGTGSGRRSGGGRQAVHAMSALVWRRHPSKRPVGLKGSQLVQRPRAPRWTDVAVADAVLSAAARLAVPLAVSMVGEVPPPLVNVVLA